MKRLSIAALVAACLFLAPARLSPQGRAPADGPPGKQLGPESCMECHQQQYEVWKASKHSTSYRTVHQEAIVPDVLSALGSERMMKKDATCMQCHYTTVSDDAAGEPVAKFGVSCEHCHGAASGWIKTHQDFGGPRDQETPEHKARRIAAAKAAGMVYPKDLFALATRCAECHGLSKSSVAATTLAKMVHMGHPMNYNYELVRYLEGTVRHRFYPPQLTVNQEMSTAELARLFVIGQAAKLVAARKALEKSADPAYKALQQKQLEAAQAELSRLKDVPEAAALIAHQDAAAARRLIAAIKDKDLFAELLDRLPKGKADFR